MGLELPAGWDWSRTNTMIAYGADGMSLGHQVDTVLVSDGNTIQKNVNTFLLGEGVKRLDISSSDRMTLQLDAGNIITTGYERYSSLKWDSPMTFALSRTESMAVSYQNAGQPSLQWNSLLIVPNAYSNSESLANSLNTDLKSLSMVVATRDFSETDYAEWGFDMEELANWGFEGFDFGGWTEGASWPTFSEGYDRHHSDALGGITCRWGEGQEVTYDF
ncbi:MAG: hypothetical protein GKC10_06705 [Methanosarcinales archaeon]|nr:hypothetical protein [Methanosarcinales archaeon]